jgi:uncharacterized protein YqeY
MLEQQIERDIKTALLAGDSRRVSTLRGVKAVLLNVKVATGQRETGLADDVVLAQLAKQSKQRQESADMYVKGGDQARADGELAEKAIIDAYLPAQLGELEIAKLVDDAIIETGADGLGAMGQVIAHVRQEAGAAADAAVIARLAKEKLQ